MPRYTTGEIAKECNVSVRTVQYYDARGILSPSELSDGGRRLYSQQDVEKMKIICFLRELEIPIDSIRQLFSEPQAEHVLELLLQEQEAQLRAEIARKQLRVATLAEARRSLRQMAQVSVESIGDIARMMERKKQLRRLRILLLVLGFAMDALQVAGLMIGLLKGIWWPFGAAIPLTVGMGIAFSALYYTRTAYICPECHTIFVPGFREAFFARHTPCTRRLRCPHCGRHGFCVETYRKDETVC